MDIKKLEYIENYFYDHCEESFIYLVLHSLFNCISEAELTTLYFNNAKGNFALRKTIESYIVKRTTNEPKRQFENIAKTLLDEYPNQSYHIQLTTRTFLIQFIRTLPTKTIRNFYDIFIQSNRVYDRLRASSVADLIWSDEVEGDLLRCFNKYKDEYSLIPLIENLEPESLCNLMERYWTKDFPSARLKRDIVNKITQLPIEKLNFLKELEISFYVLALSKKGIVITEKEIKLLLKSLTDENKYYLIWSLGLSGNWKQTTKYIEKLHKKIEMDERLT